MRNIALAIILFGALFQSADAIAYDCNSSTYVNSNGEVVHSPSCGKPSEGHETAICGDGSHSYSKHHRGTCSRHGGVGKWE